MKDDFAKNIQIIISPYLSQLGEQAKKLRESEIADNNPGAKPQATSIEETGKGIGRKIGSGEGNQLNSAGIG